MKKKFQTHECKNYKLFPRKRTCRKSEKTLKAYENNAIISRIISYENYTQRKELDHNTKQ